MSCHACDVAEPPVKLPWLVVMDGSWIWPDPGRQRSQVVPWIWIGFGRDEGSGQSVAIVDCRPFVPAICLPLWAHMCVTATRQGRRGPEAVVKLLGNMLHGAKPITSPWLCISAIIHCSQKIHLVISSTLCVYALVNGGDRCSAMQRNRRETRS